MTDAKTAAPCPCGCQVLFQRPPQDQERPDRDRQVPLQPSLTKTDPERLGFVKCATTRVQLHGFAKYDYKENTMYHYCSHGFWQVPLRTDTPRSTMPDDMTSTSTDDPNVYDPCTTTVAKIASTSTVAVNYYFHDVREPLLPLPPRERLLPLWPVYDYFLRRTRPALKCTLRRYNQRDNHPWIECFIV